MQKLYTKCLETANIEKAIRTVYSHEGAKTAGVDGISKTSNITKERIIKEVKLRLRRYKPVRSRIVQIPKGNGEFRSLTIINLFDRIAQQAVYQIISPILEEQMSKHSYGFRKGIGAKIPVSRLAATLNRNKDIYTVELDLKKCFDNIPLDKAIERLKEMEIKNFQLLRTIKHLMWTSKEYLGVGLSQGTVIGPLLANCYLTKLDRFMEETFTLNTVDKHYSRNYKNHEENWIQWNMERGKKIHCNYYRYADDTFITCHNEAEQKFIASTLGKYIDNELDIEINEAKSHYRHNEIHFLGFKIVKSGHSVWVLIDNFKEYAARLKQFKFNTYAQCQEFMKWFRGVLNYFDIVNNLEDLLRAVADKLYYRSKHGVLKKVGTKYYYGNGRERVYIDVWAMRKATRTSFKEYLFSSKWINQRELLNSRESNKAIGAAFQYLWSLWTKQKGADAITKKALDPLNMEVHHVIPLSGGGTNELDNLILIAPETHKQLHYGKDLDKRFEKYRKHLK